jgi:hypothetical protein
MEGFNGISFLQDSFRIGRWIWPHLSLRCSIIIFNRICWIPSKRHKFEVKSYYHVLTISTGFILGIRENIDVR